MKIKMIGPAFPLLLAIVFACSYEAKAVEVGVGINLGGGRHYTRGGTVIEYRTADPVYSTWYPDTTTSYVYTPVPTTTYYDNGYGYTAPITYVYSTNSSSYNGWYGSGRSGHGGYYGGGSRYDNNRHESNGHRR